MLRPALKSEFHGPISSVTYLAKTRLGLSLDKRSLTLELDSITIELPANTSCRYWCCPLGCDQGLLAR